MSQAYRSGQVVGLFQQSDRRINSPLDEIELIRGRGIAGDRHAHPMSPRQVLVVRAEDADALALDAGQLLENITVRGLPQEAFQPGSRLRLGDGAQLRLTFPCESCQHVAHLVPSLSALRGRRGLMAVALASGTVRLGDAVVAEADCFPPLDERPYGRFLAVVACIPAGRVLSYRTLLIAMGVARAYLRAIPGYLRRTPSGAYPLHRLVTSHGALRRPEQAVHLLAEGVEVGDERVDLACYEWREVSLYLMESPDPT